MKDDKLNKIFGDVWPVEQAVDSDHFRLVVVGAQFYLSPRHGPFAAMPLHAQIELALEITRIYI